MIEDFEDAIVKTFISTTKSVISFIIGWVIKRKRQQEVKLKAKKENIETLFRDIQDADFTTGKIPPDDVDSLKLFESWLREYFKRDRQIEYHRQLQLADVNKHLCSVGGPVDQFFTRYGMGYDKKGQNWKPILPFIYPIKEAEAESSIIWREWKGQRWQEINWYITDRNGKLKYMPGTDNKGVLNRDYFMLIIAPNTFTKKAFYRNQKHIMIAPAHGLAQLAIKDILDDDSILEELIEVRKKSEYLQAIIEVPATLTKDGYAPTGNFPICEVKPLDLSEFKKVERYREWI